MDSIIAKFDPNYRCQYICENDTDPEDQTIFYLRPLTVLEHRLCEELSVSSNMSIGGFGLKTIEFGLVGWENFKFSDGDEIKFSQENISAIPINNQSELSAKILDLSEPEESLIKELKFVAKWGSWIGKVKNPEQWNCDFCIEKGFQKSRNCSGDLPNKCPKCFFESYDDVCKKCGSKTTPPFKLRFSNSITDFITRCPLSIITNRAVKLTNLIMFMNESNTLPFKGGALEQTSFFYSVRSIVLSEQNSLLREEISKEENRGKKNV